MKVNDNRNKTCVFVQLENGDIFEYEGEKFIRNAPVLEADNTLTYYATVLETGVLVKFHFKDTVIPLNASVNIE